MCSNLVSVTEFDVSLILSTLSTHMAVDNVWDFGWVVSRLMAMEVMIKITKTKFFVV